MPNPSRRPDATPAELDMVRKREALVRKWAYLLSGLTVVPLTSDELDGELRDQLGILCDALRAEPYRAEPVERLGERLVGLGNVGEPGLRCTLDVLGKGLLALPEFQPVERFAERITLGLGALACGFLAADHRTVLEQQDSMQLSLLKAVRDAKWNLKTSEAMLDEVSISSTSGILIIGMDGRLVRANAAVADILGYTVAELTEVTLSELVHPDSAGALSAGMRSLLDGRKDRIRQQQRLLRKDGDIARVTLTVSLLRGDDDRSGQLVAVIEDATELMLLQNELHRQSLHDPLTGLPNRQFFSTRLESALRTADPVRGITVFHLDLDAFGMVCTSLGRRAGEQVLVHVAQRLKVVMARESAMIARFDGDEFGILIENSATTPAVETIVADINRHLAELIEVDGQTLAISASIGVVHRPSRDLDPAEPLRAADQAMRRAKTGRRGQWELFHPDHGAADRQAKALAVGMSGAWERGEISVEYRPTVRLADGGIAGIAASLRWDRPGLPPLPHDRCVDLAEQTGLILSLGNWLLRLASGQAHWWSQRIGVHLPLSVGLTVHQSCDADLVSRVVGVLDGTGLPPARLMIGMPVGVLAVPEAADNLKVLAEMGIHVVLDDVDLGHDDLAAISDLNVRSVRIARRLVARQPRAGLIRALIPLIRETGATIMVDGIDTAEQAQWWRAAGADTASGDFFGAAGHAGDVVAHFDGL
jgi:diguanylate cyclase (GGDEF)-like protein/PAS domain S-box-containing protein